MSKEAGKESDETATPIASPASTDSGALSLNVAHSSSMRVPSDIPQPNFSASSADEDLDDSGKNSVFALDEDAFESLSINERHYTEDFDEAAEGEDPFPAPTSPSRGTGRVRHVHYAPLPSQKSQAPIAASLPLAINGGGFWLRNKAIDEESFAEENANAVGELPSKDKALDPREEKMYQNMLAYSRSIQADDDPERLFGPRPERRRYRTGEELHEDGEPLPPMSRRATVSGGSALGGPRITVPASLAQRF